MADEEDEVLTFLTKQQTDYDTHMNSLPKWADLTKPIFDNMRKAVAKIDAEAQEKFAKAQQWNAKLEDKQERVGVKNIFQQATGSSSNIEPPQHTEPTTPINNRNSQAIANPSEEEKN